MTTSDRENLIGMLDEARRRMEELLPKIEPGTEVYPGWTIEHLIAHITGWDDAFIDVLQAHEQGRSPSLPAIHSLDQYNEQSVQSRRNLNYDQILRERQRKRQVLRELMMQMPDNKLHELVMVPWGNKITVQELVDIFSHHEKEHAQDIDELLSRSDKSPGREAK
jgi:uncharacterized protein (DUF885 family)